MHLAEFIGGWEAVLSIAVVLILLAVKGLLKYSNSDSNGRGSNFSVRVFVAQGFGIGRMPFAPGTFGSFLGLIWFAMLVATGNFWAYLAGCIEGIAFSIWLCDDAEKILGETDPGSIVLDEIIAIPFCFLPWVASGWWSSGTVQSVEYFFTGSALWMTLGLVVLFRVFDIWKPWPIRQIQRLPGGWGVTVDDLLAAVYVALVSLFLLRWV